MATPAVRQFAGDIRFWEKQNNGSLLPVIAEPADPSGNQPLEVNALTFGYEAGDEINVLSKRRDARYNQPIHNETLPGTTTVTVTSLEIPPIILARMLFGESTSAVVAAGSVSSVVTVLPANVSVPVQLPHRLISTSPAPVITDNAGTPVAYTAGTDYVIDHRRGQLIIPAGSTITAGSTIQVSYSYAAHVDTTIIGGATPTRQFVITGDMQDRISQENGELRIPQANLTTDGEIDWLASEPIQVTLTGPCVIASGESAPYTFNVYKATA